MTAIEAWLTPLSGLPVLGLLQALPLAAALVLLAVRRDALAVTIGLVVAVAELGIALGLYLRLDHADPGFQLAERLTLAPVLNYHAAVDGVSVLFILLTALLTLLLVVYGPGRRMGGIPQLLALVLATEAVAMSLFTTLDLLWFVGASAVQLTLVGYLMWRWATSPAKDLAVARYFQFMATGLALLLAGTLILAWSHAGQSGGAWTFDLTELTGTRLEPGLAAVVFFLFFYGLGIRTPLFPFHGWLPLAAEHGDVAVAPTLLLGLKVGVYGLLRFVFPLMPEAALEWSGHVVGFATAGIFYAALLALMQSNLRRLLAFAVVSHTSVLLIGLFSLGPEAFQGGVMLSVTFGLAIAGLLFMTGFVYQRTRTTLLGKLGGLFDHVPLLGVAFLVAGLSIVGMPGTPGFDAAHLMLEAAIARFGALVTIAAALGNVAAAGFLLLAFQRAFLAPRPPGAVESVAGLSWMERLIAVVLILVLLGSGFYPEPWLKLVDAPLAALGAQFPHE